MIQVDQSQLKLYLLGQLSEFDEEQVELRLLSDVSFAEEFDIAVNELIDQYVDDQLSAPDVERMEQHFFKARARRDKLQVTLALKKHQATKRGARSRSLFYLPIAAAVILAVVAGIAYWKLTSRPSEVDEGLAALHRAFKDQRPLEPRITGFQLYAPSSVRGPQAKVNSVALENASKLLLSAADARPNAASHHALGQFYLANRRFDEAITQFNAAISLDPQNAYIYSDLGTAFFEKGKISTSEEGPEKGKAINNYATSLDNFERALKLNGSLREALFNRALVHEYMVLPQLAEDDWRKYLEVDSTSPWADEARQRLNSLTEQRERTSQNKNGSWQNFLAAYQTMNEQNIWQAVEASSCRAGNCVVEKLADDYLSNHTNDQSHEAELRLQMLSYVAELKFRRSGDKYVLDLARTYKAATAENRAELFRVREIVKSAQERIVNSDFQTALALCEEAQQRFERTGNTPEALRAAYWSAICYSQLEKEDESAAILNRLLLSCSNRGYKWLLVRSLNALADHQFSMLHEYSTAILSGTRSAKIAEEAHDSYGLISALAFLIEVYRYLGNFDESLKYVQRILPVGGPDFSEPKQMCAKYNQISWALNSAGLYSAAADFQKSALPLALEINEFSLICATYVRLGIVFGNQQNFDAASRSVQLALNLAETRSAEPVGQQMIAYVSLQMGDLYSRAGDLAGAITSYDRAIKLFEEQNSPTFIYQAHKGRLLSYIAAGNIAAAQAELAATLAYYNQHRGKISEQSNRNSFSDLEQDVFDVAINFEYSSMGDPEKAFEFSEISRASSLLDLIRSGTPATVSPDGSDLILPEGSQPIGLSAIRASMPEDTQILQYAVLENKIIMWVLSKADFRYAEANVEQRKLNELIIRYLGLVSSPVSDSNETSRLARQLYEILVQPVESLLDSDKSLCIVPDKALNYAPYSALISPTSGRYLIEDYRLSLSPSANAFVENLRASQTKKRATSERVLSVGNPDFDARTKEGLPSLPESDREAREVASFYESSVLFRKGQAVKRDILNAMVQADVIHIASHSLVDESYPMRSRILLARESALASTDSPTDSSLTVSEIYQIPLARVRLVVLSSCQTGIGRSYRGEGVMSIARPFIAQGVPEVVASLWSVESASTAELMINFHKIRKDERLNSAEALRRAQLFMLNGPRQLYRQPYYWAPFNMIGSASQLN